MGALSYLAMGRVSVGSGIGKVAKYSGLSSVMKVFALDVSGTHWNKVR